MNRKFWNINFIKRSFSNISILIEMFKDIKAGYYRIIPIKALSAIGLLFAYILNPFDLITDVIPFWGQMDDFGILIICLYLIEQEAARYQQWKAGNKVV
jgi:uncharacterized membrane protein YkvA (DUF1232 family)